MTAKEIFDILSKQTFYDFYVEGDFDKLLSGDCETEEEEEVLRKKVMKTISKMFKVKDDRN